MPTINHEPIPIPIFTDFDGVICRKWPAMANGDVGEPIALTRYSDRTVGQIDFRVSGFVAP